VVDLTTNRKRRKSAMKSFMRLFVVGFIAGVLAFAANAQATDKETLKAEIKEELKEELKAEGGFLEGIAEHISLSGLIEFGGAWEDVDYTDDSSEEQSDLALTTVELTAEAEVNEWVGVEATLLYEDPTFENDETSVDLDAAILTIGNIEEYPLYFSAGAMYVPFGALLTHFPDDPLVDQPLTLLLGETREKAALLGIETQGFSLSGYVFNGDVDEAGEEDQIESYGVDVNYAFDDEAGFDILVGGSYISNLADSDGLEEVEEVEAYVGGYDVYLHIGFAGFFIDGEYMTAAEEFEPTEIASDGDGAQPAVWNIEAGYNFPWGEGFEVALKYAGSDESEELGYPEERYGICFNKVIFEDVIASLGYLHDEYEDADAHGRDKRDVVFGQIAIEF
jgi:hypothetical protein